MLFDSHTHMNNDGLSSSQRERIASEIEASKVSFVADIGFDIESSMTAARHAERYSWCYATVGIHPHNAKDMDDMSIQMLKALAKKPKVMFCDEPTGALDEVTGKKVLEALVDINNTYKTTMIIIIPKFIISFFYLKINLVFVWDNEAPAPYPNPALKPP